MTTIGTVRAAVAEALNTVDSLTAGVIEPKVENLPHAWITRLATTAGSFGAVTLNYTLVVQVAVSNSDPYGAQQIVDALIDEVLDVLTGDLGGQVDDCWWTSVDGIGEIFDFAGFECVGFTVTVEVLA